METKYSNDAWKQLEKKLISDQIQQLRKTLKEKHEICVPAHCDDLIARCIRMKDGDLEKALSLLKGYHFATGDFPSWDATFKPTRDIDGYHAGKLMVLSQRDDKGRLIYIGRMGMWDPETSSFDQGAASIWMLLQYITAVSIDTQRNGIVTIWDFTGFSMKHVLAINKWRAPQLARIVQNGLAGRLKEFHVINHPKLFSMVYSTIIKPFLKEKLKKRITFHDNLDTLHERFDRNGLPTFAGGCQTIEDCTDWNLMTEFLSQDKYFIDMMNNRFPRY